MSDQEDICRRLDNIESQLVELNRKLWSKHLCSAPNTCLVLKENFEALEDRFDRVVSRVEGLERWRAWMTGVAVMLITLFGLFGPVIRRALKLD